jgi:superfamily I DNA/RNA helicase
MNSESAASSESISSENDPLLATLNPSQREAVQHTDGPLLIFAGAGSGKTRVLTHRIAFLIARKGVRPRQILAVTFTNKAATEMKERLNQLVGLQAGKEMWVGTFHAVCARLLRERGDSIGLPRDFVVYDDGDQITLIKECLSQLNLDDRQYTPRGVLSLISRAKEKLISPEEFPRHFKGLFESVVGRLYVLYQDKLRLNRALDFDDLITTAVRMLQQREEVREHYQQKFRYVLVDEYQDVNHAQYMLTRILSGANDNICIVGDDDQCLPQDTAILTPDGCKRIDAVNVGETVFGSGGLMQVVPGTVKHVHRSHFAGSLHKIIAGEECLLGTDLHQIFVRMSETSGEIDARAIRLHMFAGDGQHHVRLPDGCSDELLNECPMLSRSIGLNKNTLCFANYHDAKSAVRGSIAALDSMPIGRTTAQFSDRTFVVLPLNQVTVGTVVLVHRNGMLQEQEITAVETVAYNGPVFDLEVNRLHCYVAGGILVHNSVYGWRGADVEIILSFERDYPNAKIVKLEQNYRSTKNILDTAYHVVSKNRNRAEKRLWTENPIGEEINLHEAANEQEEGIFIATIIGDQKRKKARKYSDFAILYRTNAQSRVLEEVLINYRIPYRIIGGLKFYERKEIKDILAYVRLVHNPYDSVALRRVINVPARGIGAGTWTKIEERAIFQNVSLWDIVTDLGQIEGLKAAAKKAVEAFVALIAFLRSKRDELTVTQITELILENTGYVRELEQERTVEAQTRLENVKELLSVTKNFEATTEDPTLRGFLEQAALIADIDSLEQNGADSVVLMTLHSAKGLEFPVVFLTGLEEGIFPHRNSMQKDSQMEEERRLAYVGITRAKEELFLTHASRRTLFGNTQMNAVSRFIREIPNEMFKETEEKRKPSVIGSRSTGRWQRDEFSQIESWDEARTSTKTPASRKPITTPPPAGEAPFKVGQKVKHAVFGQGVVVSCLGIGDEAQVSVAFPNVGIKKLVAGYARLEKV